MVEHRWWSVKLSVSCQELCDWPRRGHWRSLVSRTSLHRSAGGQNWPASSGTGWRWRSVAAARHRVCWGLDDEWRKLADLAEQRESEHQLDLLVSHATRHDCGFNFWLLHLGKINYVLTASGLVAYRFSNLYILWNKMIKESVHFVTLTICTIGTVRSIPVIFSVTDFKLCILQLLYTHWCT